MSDKRFDQFDVFDKHISFVSYRQLFTKKGFDRRTPQVFHIFSPLSLSLTLSLSLSPSLQCARQHAR